jgi:SagB-type dehydrogenase family enzyme
MHGFFSKTFHKETDFNYELGKLPSDPQYWPKEWKEIYHKEYPRFPKIPLSKDYLILGALKDALMNRQSARDYDLSSSLTLEELSTLLHYSAGIKTARDTDPSKVRRYYPSGGARYPLEVYLAIQRVKGIKPGIYHYNVKEHLLETLTQSEQDLDQLHEGLYYPWSRDAAVIYLVTSVWNRNMIKYKDRGYRIILMEAGHLTQNLALASAALKIGCCNSVGFHNQRINEILDIENEDEASIYMALLGK